MIHGSSPEMNNYSAARTVSREETSYRMLLKWKKVVIGKSTANDAF